MLLAVQLKELLLLSTIPLSWHDNIVAVIIALVVIGFLILSFYISRRVLMPLINHITDRMDGDTLAATVEERPALASHIAHLVPAMILIVLVKFFFGTWPMMESIASKITLLYLYSFIGLTVAGLVNLLAAIFAVRAEHSNVPYKMISQLIKLLTAIVVVIMSASLIVGSSPAYLLSGLGALTAVLLLAFKDALLGLVASIQIAANRMVSRGDWIEMPKYGADGNVVEVALTTVKVRNWDNTITTLPTYALISESFKNWRAMQESGGRRIKRAILIDIHTIRFIDPADLEALQQQHVLKRFFAEQVFIDLTQDDLTNAALFRAYVEWSLRHHPHLNQSLTLMVRELQPTEVGLPIEIYCFSADKNWINYEKIQADIFDKLLAILPVFGLSVFQRISGRGDSSLG